MVYHQRSGKSLDNAVALLATLPWPSMMQFWPQRHARSCSRLLRPTLRSHCPASRSSPMAVEATTRFGILSETKKPGVSFQCWVPD